MQGGRSPLVSKARQIFFQIVLDFFPRFGITHLMKTYYYIARRMFRGKLRYAGDGIWMAPNKTIARKEISQCRGVPASRIKLSDYKS